MDLAFAHTRWSVLQRAGTRSQGKESVLYYYYIDHYPRSLRVDNMP